LKKVLLGLTAAAVLAFSATASASSPAAYKSQVNAICAKGVAQLDAVPTPKSAAAIYPYFKQVAKLSDALLVKVSKVTPPASLAVAVSRAVTAQGKFEVALDALVAKLKTSSSPQQTALASRAHLTRLNNAANKAWIAAGLVKCGS
jgi:hypothetical protein